MLANDISLARAIEFITLLPDFIQPDLISDPSFRDHIDLKLNGSMSFGNGLASFRRDRFFAAVEEGYASAVSQRLESEDGQVWTLSQASDVGADALRIEAEGKSLLVRGYFGVRGEATERLAGFDAAVAEAGLSPEDLPVWRTILEERKLNIEELRQLSEVLELTPRAQMARISASLDSGTTEMTTVVPEDRRYYEWLIGAPVASVRELSDEALPAIVGRLLAWDRLEGAKQAMALSSHALSFAKVDFSSLTPEDFLVLADWATATDDLISKVGMVELGLPQVGTNAALEAPLLTLVQQICAADPADPEGSLQLLTALFVLVDGELSRTKVLADYAPFQRRLASLTHASLFIREAADKIDRPRFSAWAFETRGRMCYLQTHIDLQVEPRWLPEYIDPRQFKAELVGRLHNAAGRNEAILPDGLLRDFLTGSQSESESLSKHIQFPSSFVPGPIEGGPPLTLNPLPEEFREFLERPLDPMVLEPMSVIALINLQGVFLIDPAFIERAVELIKSAEHRFTATTDDQTVRVLLVGLASVACIARNVDLAEQVRILCRRHRRERPGAASLRRELLTAMVAAAANERFDDWLKFAGEWIDEIAFAIMDKGDATNLHADLDAICTMEPRLRTVVGRAMAGLDLFVRA